MFTIGNLKLVLGLDRWTPWSLPLIFLHNMDKFYHMKQHFYLNSWMKNWLLLEDLLDDVSWLDIADKTTRTRGNGCLQSENGLCKYIIAHHDHMFRRRGNSSGRGVVQVGCRRYTGAGKDIFQSFWSDAV